MGAHARALARMHGKIRMLTAPAKKDVGFLSAMPADGTSVAAP
jgi:hypothetical protein